MDGEADDLIVAALFEFLRSGSQSGVGVDHVRATWQNGPSRLVIVPLLTYQFTSFSDHHVRKSHSMGLSSITILAKQH